MEKGKRSWVRCANGWVGRTGVEGGEGERERGEHTHIARAHTQTHTHTHTHTKNKKTSKTTPRPQTPLTCLYIQYILIYLAKTATWDQPPRSGFLRSNVLHAVTGNYGAPGGTGAPGRNVSLAPIADICLSLAPPCPRKPSASRPAGCTRSAVANQIAPFRSLSKFSA